ncbi:MAG TPA: hypothetical protein VFB58_09920 [Chloroflexota bacterium]|nr:hypothetical protein [Chloroflexota bacterium]
MGRARPRRRGFELRRITLGDWVVLVSSLLTLVSLFLPWFVTNVQGAHDQWAFTYSEVYSVIVIVIFLATIFLVLYPVAALEFGLSPLPFSSPLLYFLLGIILLLLSVFEVGKYACIQCQGVVGGFGVYVAVFASLTYILGAVIRWGSRPRRRVGLER